MPNWCYNELTVNKSDTDKILNKNGEVDFNILVPMPKSLDIESGSYNDEAIIYYLSNRDNIAWNTVKKKCMGNEQLMREFFSFGGEADLDRAFRNLMGTMERRKNNTDSPNGISLDRLYDMGRTIIENIKLYGHGTWYSWCKAKWGTKWNAATSNIKDRGDKVTIYFETAWYEPGAWLEALHGKGVPFTLHAVDEFGQGEVEWKSDGKTITKEFFESEDTDSENEED